MKSWLTKANAETAIDLWHRFKGRAMSRRAGYLIFTAVALETDLLQLVVRVTLAASNIKISVPDTPHGVSIAFVAFAVALLIADRYLPEQSNLPVPNHHDIRLLKDIRAKFDWNVKIFLRDHDFHAYSFDWDSIKPLNEVDSVWRGPEYEFIDTPVQEAWQRVRLLIRAFLTQTATYSGPSDFHLSRSTPYLPGESPENCSEVTHERIQKMNDLATNLIDAFYEMDRLARRRIPFPE